MYIVLTRHLAFRRNLAAKAYARTAAYDEPQRTSLFGDADNTDNSNDPSDDDFDVADSGDLGGDFGSDT